MISLSLLPSVHLRSFQPSRVRTFIPCYRDFILTKGRSPPLRVYCRRLNRPFRTRFRFASAPEGLKLAADNNSQTHYAKGTPSPRPFWILDAGFWILDSGLLIFLRYPVSSIKYLGPEWTRLRHLVSSGFQVLFHSLSKGSFRLSLAVLVHYRSPSSI